MIRNSPYILLVLAACIWGGNFVAGKALVTHIPPLTLAALRWSIAFVCLLPFFGKEGWRLGADFLRHWKMILFLSVTGVAGFNTLTYIAVQYTGSINASLMNSATPIMVVILTWLMIKERIAWSAIPGILVSMAGVLWIIGNGSLDALLSLSFNKGDLWMLLAIFCWSLYSVGMKRMAGMFPASPFLLVQVVVALLLLLPLSAIELIIDSPEMDWTPPLVLGVMYIGIFASIVAFLSWNRAIELIGPQRCAGFLNLIPLFSAIFATSFTGESIRLYHVIGAALILAGIYITNRKQANKA
ncbi:DMT family transporter [Paenibacillus abyssi]|uniref:Transporter n=1 Tax=Paenibacillus abyssi TaxID=1340531 RepID=A0A917LCE4_9BACL|nr:DMT family transporter [Paenibacillus abyssi]GGG14018.1 transporter [Paenibacillus abyssi]